MSDHNLYYVLHPDETRGYGIGPSSFIPSLGSPTTVIDLYRTVALASTKLPDIGAAFTDETAAAALSRIAEGGVNSFSDLDSAELALQALLLNDVVHVLIPAPKLDYGNGFISYLTKSSSARTQFTFDLFSLAGSHDYLIAPEFLRSEAGIIVNSTLSKSPIIGMSVDMARDDFDFFNENGTEALNVIAEMHGIPAYFSNPALVRSRRGDGFEKRFYHRLKVSWDAATGDIPPIVCTFGLPPLLAVVLDRLTNRADLKSVISDLRAELVPVRKELKELNSIITKSISEAEVERRMRRVVESFDAIVPESRLSSAQRINRRLFTIQGLVRPIIKFAMGFATKGGATLEDGIKAADGIRNLVIENKSIINRTITAQIFSNLVRTDSLQALIKHHLSVAEIAAIEKSIRASNPKA